MQSLHFYYEFYTLKAFIGTAVEYKKIVALYINGIGFRQNEEHDIPNTLSKWIKSIIYNTPRILIQRNDIWACIIFIKKV